MHFRQPTGELTEGEPDGVFAGGVFTRALTEPPFLRSLNVCTTTVLRVGAAPAEMPISFFETHFLSSGRRSRAVPQ